VQSRQRINALTSKFYTFSIQNSDRVPLTKLSTLKNSPFFGLPCIKCFQYAIQLKVNCREILIQAILYWRVYQSKLLSSLSWSFDVRPLWHHTTLASQQSSTATVPWLVLISISLRIRSNVCSSHSWVAWSIQQQSIPTNVQRPQYKPG